MRNEIDRVDVGVGAVLAGIDASARWTWVDASASAYQSTSVVQAGAAFDSPPRSATGVVECCDGSAWLVTVTRVATVKRAARTASDVVDDIRGYLGF